jgi:hypothetical protein
MFHITQPTHTLVHLKNGARFVRDPHNPDTWHIVAGSHHKALCGREVRGEVASQAHMPNLVVCMKCQAGGEQ